MGCDIHIVVEVKHDGQWVGMHSCPYTEAEMYPREALTNAAGEPVRAVMGFTHWPLRSRNYELFAALAGVRGNGPAAKGMPPDASALARMESAHWGEDGHSHSYCTAERFLKFACKHNSLPDIVRKTIEEGANGGVPDTLKDYVWKYLGVSEHVPMKDVRIVFWFDN